MKKFPPATRATIEKTGYFYIRSGSDHRFIAVWVVVVDGRVLIRSWNDKPTGWFRAFQKNSRGFVRVGKKEVPVRARKVRSAKLIAAMDAAYATKYTSKANLKYVKGFRTKKRQATSTELVPA